MGFESFEPFFWQTTNGQDIAELGKRCLDAIGDRDITISTLGMFGNPLDHIYVRGLTLLDATTEKVESSDHNPLSAILRL